MGHVDGHVASAGGHVAVRCLWSVLQLVTPLGTAEALRMTMVHTSSRNHVEGHDPCCCWLLEAGKLPLQWYIDDCKLKIENERN